MSLCVCGHPSKDHRQHDSGEWCLAYRCFCPGYRKAADSRESTAILSAGGSPEGLAPETIAESVNRPAVNKAAERLLELADRNTIDGPFAQLLEAALATEREAAGSTHAPALDAGPHWGNDGGMTDLIEKARDFRYSDEWIGNAFRARLSESGGKP